MKFSIVAAVLALRCGSAAGRVENSAIYPLKQRQGQAVATKRFNLTELPYYEVSYSEDSTPKLLSRFTIALFETDGLLPFYPSLFNVEMALQDFVEAELNSAYAPFSRIKKVHAKVVSQKNTASTRNKRLLQMRGSELEMELNVTFANEPSPETSDVDLALKFAMENMAYFLTNLTKRADGDLELKNVHSAFRWEISDSNQVQKPPEIDLGADPRGDQAQEEKTKTKMIIPVVFAICAVTVLVGLFVIRRQHQSRTGGGGAHEFTSNDFGMHWDDDSDIFSFETALLNAPHDKAFTGKSGSMPSGGDDLSNKVCFGDEENEDTRAPSEGIYQLTEIELGSPGRDSVMNSSSQHKPNHDLFSELASGYPSQSYSPSTKGEARSMFGFFSGRTNGTSKSAQASNIINGEPDLQMARDVAVAEEQSPKEISPGSHTSSVFTFSDAEEGQHEDDSHDDVMDIINGIEGSSLSNWHDHDIKDDEHETSFGITSVRNDNEDENIPEKNVLSTSAERLGFSASPESEQRRPFDMGSAQNDPVQLPAASRSTGNIKSTSLGDEGLCLASESTGSLHFGSSLAHLQRKSFSDSKIKRDIEPAFVLPKSHSDSKPKNVNDSDVLFHGLKSVESASVKKNLSKDGSGYHDWGITLRPVTSPGRPQKELIEFREQINNPECLKDTQQGQQFNRPENLWDSDELNSLRKKGRRHTKSTLGDGTTNYQNEAMDPQDWSVTTGDDGSCASTEVADITPQKSGKKKRNFLSSFFSGSKRKDADGSVAVEATTAIEKSPASTATDDQYSAAEAATNKQLISELVWLEKKIASANDIGSSPGSESSEIREHYRQIREGNEKRLDTSHLDSVLEDSLSFRTGDHSRSYNGSSLDTTSDFMSPTVKKDPTSKELQTILCRDCYAPPGKLKIVIHSTKDGPAIHTIKSGSALEGHLFPGDLIISVDDIDTRSYTAEQVMKMMTERARYERKISVLHFEEAEEM